MAINRSGNKSFVLIIVAVYTVLALMVPNVWLDISEINSPVMGKILNIFFPLSFYLFLIAIFKKQGWGLLCCLPFMILSAFQIVLLFLYGESLIAVDMFLNVATTDFEEATTLLGNLMPAIILVCILYLPGLLWGGIAISRKLEMPHYPRLIMLWWGSAGVFVFGILLLILSLCHKVVPGNDIFPINVINNCAIAVKRANLASQYPESATNFHYNAVTTDTVPKIITIVIGETSRPDRWQLFGAERETNPNLSRREGIHTFQHAITQSNTTHKSVPLLLTPLTAENFGELNNYKSIITAFKEAGYRTSWISNQPPNGAYNENMGYEADTTLFFKYISDVELAAEASKLLDSRDTTMSQLLVLHTYGGHFPYKERYQGMEPVFTPDEPMMAKKSNRDALLNAYDNATIATDIAIDSIIGKLAATNQSAMLIYAADHGEDIFDDYREKFLHASPAPTYYQLRVPMFVWTSDEFNNARTDSVYNLEKYRLMPLSPAVTLFHTVIDAANIDTPYFKPELSLFNPDFNPGKLQYLTDRNEVVDLTKSGLREVDIQDFLDIGVNLDFQ